MPQCRRNFGSWIGRWPCNIAHCTDKWKIHHETSFEISFQCGMSDIAENKNHDECRRCREWFPCEFGLFRVVSRCTERETFYAQQSSCRNHWHCCSREIAIVLPRFTCHCVRHAQSITSESLQPSASGLRRGSAKGGIKHKTLWQRVSVQSRICCGHIINKLIAGANEERSIKNRK